MLREKMEFPIRELSDVSENLNWLLNRVITSNGEDEDAIEKIRDEVHRLNGITESLNDSLFPSQPDYSINSRHYSFEEYDSIIRSRDFH